MKLIWLIGIGIALSLSLLPAQAGVYRWVDGAGQVHYGDQPQPGSKAETLSDAAITPVASAPSDAGVSDAQAVAIVREGRCKQAQQSLAQFQQASSLKMRGPDGKVHTLSPEEQVKAIVSMQKNVESFCGEPDSNSEPAAAPANPEPAEESDARPTYQPPEGAS